MSSAITVATVSVTSGHSLNGQDLLYNCRNVHAVKKKLSRLKNNPIQLFQTVEHLQNYPKSSFASENSADDELSLASSQFLATIRILYLK